jgi:hypothetical protein
MKTITYNTEKEIRVGIMIAIFTVAIFATIKVREFQMKDTYMVEETRADRIEYIHSTIPVLPYADAKLIEEPAPLAATPTAADAASARELAVQMETWINTKSYWSQEEVESEKELVHKMTTCLKNGSYFSDETFDELPADNEKELTHKMTTNLKNGTYFSDENLDELPVDNEKELTRSMTTTLKNGSYFSDENFEEVPVENKAELTTQMKLSLVNGDYWNEDNK